MRLSIALLVLQGMTAASAFSSRQQPSLAFSATSIKKTTTTTTLHMATGTTPERVKSSGAGLAMQPAGNHNLFDPNEQGKLSGTHNCDDRVAQGVSYQQQPAAAAAAATAYLAPVSEMPDNAVLQQAQHWLEDIGVPTAFAKATAPVQATVLGRTKLIEDSAPGDIEHVILKLPDGMHYVEGQSLSVIPPGLNEKGKPQKPRLYSIASTRYGDVLDGNTISLCVRRAEFYDAETGKMDPEKTGVCSAFLCDCEPGDTVQVAGPVGKTMLLPEDPSTDIIMVATGTGIAPFRGFLHRLYMENTVARHMFSGDAWLILGVPVTGGLLYAEEISAMQQHARQEGTSEFTVDYAISREMTNSQGGKLYVQHVLQNKADALWDRLDQGAHIYFCGLKGMMPGILEALEQVAEARGVNWSAKLKELKSNNQWHVEVY